MRDVKPPKSLVFELEATVRLKVDGFAVRKLQHHAQHGELASEAGGVLLGRWIAKDGHFVIDAISDPMPGDRATRRSFFRSVAHNDVINASLRRSRNTCGYLGEWHTHPEPHPTPSGVDLRDWHRRTREDRLDIPRVFFIIVGTVGIIAWTADRASRRIDPLRRATSSG